MRFKTLLITDAYNLCCNILYQVSRQEKSGIRESTQRGEKKENEIKEPLKLLTAFENNTLKQKCWECTEYF